MRALITGGAGFIGSHLCDALLHSGHEVIVLDDLSTGRLSNIQHVQDQAKFRLEVGDVTDRTLVQSLVRVSDVVFHLAASVGVQRVIDHSLDTLHINVLGTECVLGACCQYDRPVLVASSSEVYGRGSRIPFSETDDLVLGPANVARWCYGTSKALDEHLALAYHREQGLKAVVARLFNTVGPRQTGQYGMVVPTFVRQALAGVPITVYGDGGQSRCFADVSDVVGALISLIEHPDTAGQIVNIGSIEEVTILRLAQRAKEIAESASPIAFVPYEQAYGTGFEDMRRRVPDLSRIKSLIGYEPTVDLDGILRRMITHEKTTARTYP